MFTGIVEGLGTVQDAVAEQNARRLVIAYPSIAQRSRVGDSVAINGCCLTVVDRSDDRFAFQAGPETLARTNLGELRPGDRVNLERPLAAGEPLGGHFVQGHVDGTGTVCERNRQGDWEMFWVAADEGLMRQMVPKGSVAVDGVSLTLVDVLEDRFSVALIPHTLAVTTLGFRRVGDRVNIETDLLGKYVFRYLEAGGTATPQRD
jgi:riboflavin synthase